MPAGEPTPEATAADVILASLHRHGIEFFFANPGTDFPPIVEGFARARIRDAEVPRPILVPHENLAVGMAHGASLMTGRPQSVMVHVNVGTANTINLLANAARDRIPLLLMAGRSPILDRGAFGARSRPIHWAQEMFDQAGMVREFVKWDYELRNTEQAGSVVARALEVAMAEPRGPVYLTLPREPLSAASAADSSDGPRCTNRLSPGVRPVADLPTQPWSWQLPRPASGAPMGLHSKGRRRLAPIQPAEGRPGPRQQLASTIRGGPATSAASICDPQHAYNVIGGR